MKKILLLLTLLLSINSLHAEDFVVDGIAYNITSEENSTVEVCWVSNNLSEIVFPSKVTYFRKEYRVTSIGYQACLNNNGITSLSISNSITNIGDRAFSQCTKLTSVHFGDNVKHIGVGTFQFCKGLTNVVIPKNVESIGLTAFGGCNKLEAIVVDKDNTIFDSRENSNAIIETSTNTMVVGCKNSYFPKSVTHIGNYAFAHNTSITNFTIPNHIVSVGGHSFAYCEALETITIGNNVTEIGEWTFYGCYNLRNATIGESIETIEDYAFCGCENLMDIQVDSRKAITANENIFSEAAYNNACLHVPNGSKVDYEATSPWNKFYHITEMGITAIDDVIKDNNTPKVYYDLNGRAVTNPTKGIYILNGKKVLVK